jgi:drug/metabolite transporter (DMT)-like permease
MTPAMSPRTAALVAIVAAMIIWGSTFVVTKAAAQQFPPLTLGFLRFAFGSLALAALLRARGRLTAPWRAAPWRQLLLLAFTGVAVFTSAFNYALVYGSAAQGTLLYALVPAAVAVCAALILRERLTQRRVIGVALSIGGAVLLVTGGEAEALRAPAPLAGAAFMLGAVVMWALYTVIAKSVAHADLMQVTLAIAILGAGMLLPASAIELAVLGWPAPSAAGWLGVLYLAVLASAAAYVLYGFALKKLDASTVGVYNNIDPVVGLVIAFALGETLAWLQAGGAAVVLLGMWLASTEPRRARA